MNQPTREEFEAFKAEIREEVKQLREQRTEEIKVTRVEVASADVLTQLKALDGKLGQIIQTQTDHSGKLEALERGQQELKEDVTVLKDDVGVLKIEMQGARADILQIRESQADLRDRLSEHGQHLKAIEEKQDRHTATLGDLLNFAESHDALLKNVATKDDIKNTATKDDLKQDLEAFGTRLLDKIAQMLQQNRPES